MTRLLYFLQRVSLYTKTHTFRHNNIACVSVFSVPVCLCSSFISISMHVLHIQQKPYDPTTRLTDTLYALGTLNEMFTMSREKLRFSIDRKCRLSDSTLGRMGVGYWSFYCMVKVLVVSKSMSTYFVRMQIISDEIFSLRFVCSPTMYMHSPPPSCYIHTFSLYIALASHFFLLYAKECFFLSRWVRANERASECVFVCVKIAHANRTYNTID